MSVSATLRFNGLIRPARRRFSERLAGHAWTIGPALAAYVAPPPAPPAAAFETAVPDPILGAVRLTGRISHHESSDTLVLIVHGLAGDATSPYCAAAARAARAAGYASLRLSLRGADHSGEDILHGGITQDLWAALAAPEVARYRRIFLLGYSVGGHVALRAAIECKDPRLCAAAAICPPLDLNAATKAFDHPARAIYRRHIFAGLNKAYAAAAARKRVCTPVEAVVSARSCRERDALTVVPRFGFRNADDYYECESAGPRLHRLRIPALVITTRHDPIIPAETLVPTLENASPAFSIAWIERGGHIYGPHRLEDHAMHWLSKQ